MTPKERLLVTMRHGVPDRVPVVPDMSNMIPARLTGKPFWDIYLYQDPPLWMAYIDAVKHFGFSGFLDYQVGVQFSDEIQKDNPWTTAIVERTDDRIVTRAYRKEDSSFIWSDFCDVYPVDNPPTEHVPFATINLPAIPEHWEPLEGVKEWPVGEELFELAYEMMGDHGCVGMSCGTSAVIGTVEAVYQYCDDPEVVREESRQILEASMRRMDNIEKMRVRPDYVSCGASGSLVYQTVEMFRDVSLPIVQAVTKRCKDAGIVSHVHSCGPETELVKICALETDLDIIDPLEIPPMGDCDLPELKKLYGDKICLKGNLHTTEVMLRGSYDDVFNASIQAMTDADASKGGFVLSTGDQCGRDTPEENIKAMIDAAESFGGK